MLKAWHLLFFDIRAKHYTRLTHFEQVTRLASGIRHTRLQTPGWVGRDSGLITNNYRFVFFVLARHLLYNRDFQAPPADWSAESFDTDCKLKTTDNNIHSHLRLRSKIVRASVLVKPAFSAAEWKLSTYSACVASICYSCVTTNYVFPLNDFLPCHQRSAYA